MKKLITISAIALIAVSAFASSSLKNEDSQTHRIRLDRASGGVSNTTINPYTSMDVAAGDSLNITDVDAFRVEDGKRYIIKNGEITVK